MCEIQYSSISKFLEFKKQQQQQQQQQQQT